MTKRGAARKAALVALFAALTAAGAFLTIPAGSVPFTLQTLFVLLSGLLLGPKHGALAQMVYVVAGLVGFPVFAGFSSGLAYVLKPTFGFLLSFAPAAAITGAVFRTGKRSFWRGLAACACGLVVQYAVGAPYMLLILHFIIGTEAAGLAGAAAGLAVFLPADALKAACAAAVVSRAVPAFNTIILGDGRV